MEIDERYVSVLNTKFALKLLLGTETLNTHKLESLLWINSLKETFLSYSLLVMIAININNFLYVEDTREIFNENIIPDLNSIVSSYLPNFNTCKYIFS